MRIKDLRSVNCQFVSMKPVLFCSKWIGALWYFGIQGVIIIIHHSEISHFPTMARNLEKEMIDYCWGNQLEEVKACLTLKVDVNTVSEDGRWSGLNIAAKKNNLELLEILLSHPDIKINNSGLNRRWTALMFACRRGNSAIVSRLV